MDQSRTVKQHHVSRDMIISQWLKSRSLAWEEGGGGAGGEDAHINLMNIHGEALLPSEVDYRGMSFGGRR